MNVAGRNCPTVQEKGKNQVPEILSLYELNQLIRSVIDTAFYRTFLVTAEIASCDVKRHCYLTLVDKDEDTIRAEIRAVIWASRYRTISAVFEEAAGTRLAAGIRILFEAEVSFHERYGLKLNILDIDPSYTIGEMAVRRREIMERLAREGLKDRNRELEFPLVPQRIGIVSSATAAGYEDLITHLMNNSYGYKFTCRLYEAVMQGDGAEGSILAALDQCMKDSRFLDIVVIVRGGGAQTDLHCFDSFGIGRAIALLPLPVISGIGHQRDVTVVDEVSNMRAKTPTAAADMIITRVRDFEDRMDSLSHNLVHAVRTLTSGMSEGLSALSKRLEASAGKELLDNMHMLNVFAKGIRYALKFIRNEKQRLKTREGNIRHLDPVNVLRRGYSITYNNGRAVKSVSDVDEGDVLRTVLHDGEIASTVREAGRKRGGYHDE